MMRERINKLIVALAAVGLVVPFALVALAVGMRAVAWAERSQDGLLLVGLALLWAATGVLKNARPSGEATCGEQTLHIAPRQSARRSFVAASSST